MTKIKEISSEDYERWTRFIERIGDTSFYHQIQWRKFIEIQHGSRLKPVYLIAQNKNEIEGLLPLFVFKHWLFGKKMISLPFSILGGCCARTKIAEELLIRKAIGLTQELNLDYLELRHLHEIKTSEMVTDKSYFTLRLKLENDFQELQKKFRATTRRYIRRAQEKELEINMFSDDIDAFYQIYSRGQRDLGTPILGYNWLRNLFSYFQEIHRVSLVHHKGKLIAAVLLRVYKNTITYVIGASLLEYRHLYPNYRLFGALLKYFCEKGYQYFDFGRSIENSGSYFFKVGWGAEPIQLYYQYYLRNNKTIPSTNQANPKRIMFARLWKRLPLSVANVLGPMIRRCYP